MNLKGGMDNLEFEKYVENNLLGLYPDAADVEGRRVIMKVDSGPGRMNIKLIAKLRASGIYLYPSVPNTTAVLQETNQSYGLFKSQIRKTLQQVTND